MVVGLEKIRTINVYPPAEPVDLDGIDDRDPPVSEDVEIVFVKNALVGPFGHITKGFTNIELVSYPQHRGAIGIKGILSNYFLKKKIKIDRPAVGIISGWSDGFYHFTLESLAKLYVLRNQIEGATIVLPVKSPKFQQEWLDILGFTDITYVGVRELVQTPLVISANFPASGSNHHNIVLPEFREWVLSKVENKAVLGRRKILVGRPAGSQRNLINQHELAAALEKKGFTFLLMEDYSLKDQINIFRNAEEIVAVHGAALALLAFSSPGTKVIDLIHEKYKNQCFLKLSKIMKLEYFRLACIGEPTTDQDARLKDYSVEIDKVLDLLGGNNHKVADS